MTSGPIVFPYVFVRRFNGAVAVTWHELAPACFCILGKKYLLILFLLGILDVQAGLFNWSIFFGLLHGKLREENSVDFGF